MTDSPAESTAQPALPELSEDELDSVVGPPDDATRDDDASTTER